MNRNLYFTLYLWIPVFSFVSCSNKTINDDDSYTYRWNFVSHYFFIWYLPMIICVGLVGNLLCLMFLFKSRLFAPNMLLWLVSICFGDIMTVALEGIWLMLKHPHKIDFRDTGKWICKFHTAFSHYFFFFSAYMQCFLSIERSYIILRPLRARGVSGGLKKPLILHLSTSILLLLTIYPYMEGWDLKEENCISHDEYYRFTTILQTVVWGIIPLLGMITATAIICCNILHVRKSFTFQDTSSELRKRKSAAIMTQNVARYVSQSQTTSILLHQRLRHFSEVNNPKIHNIYSAYKNKTRHSVAIAGLQHRGIRHGGSDNSGHVTTLLICMNIWYIISNFPFLIYLIYRNFTAGEMHRDKHRFYFYMCRCLCFLNNSFDWLFYCVAGRIFRKRVLQLLRKYFKICICKRSNLVFTPFDVSSKKVTESNVFKKDKRSYFSDKIIRYTQGKGKYSNSELETINYDGIDKIQIDSSSLMSLQSFKNGEYRSVVQESEDTKNGYEKHISSRICFNWKISITCLPKIFPGTGCVDLCGWSSKPKNAIIHNSNNTEYDSPNVKPISGNFDPQDDSPSNHMRMIQRETTSAMMFREKIKNPLSNIEADSESSPLPMSFQRTHEEFQHRRCHIHHCKENPRDYHHCPVHCVSSHVFHFREQFTALLNANICPHCSKKEAEEASITNEKDKHCNNT